MNREESAEPCCRTDGPLVRGSGSQAAAVPRGDRLPVDRQAWKAERRMLGRTGESSVYAFTFECGQILLSGERARTRSMHESRSCSTTGEMSSESGRP